MRQPLKPNSAVRPRRILYPLLLAILIALVASACVQASPDDALPTPPEPSSVVATTAGSSIPSPAPDDIAVVTLRAQALPAVEAWASILGATSIPQFAERLDALDPQGTLFAGPAFDAVLVTGLALTAWQNCTDTRGCPEPVSTTPGPVSFTLLEPGSGTILPTSDGYWYVAGAVGINTPVFSTLVGGFIFDIDTASDTPTVVLRDMVLWNQAPADSPSVGSDLPDPPETSGFWLRDMISTDATQISALKLSGFDSTTSDLEVSSAAIWLTSLTPFSADALIVLSAVTDTGDPITTDLLIDPPIAGDLGPATVDAQSYRPVNTRILWPSTVMPGAPLLLREVYALDSFAQGLSGEYQFGYQRQTGATLVTGTATFVVELNSLITCTQIPEAELEVLRPDQFVLPPTG